MLFTLSILAFAATAVAQNMQFCYPPVGTTVTAGQPFTVSLNEADSTSGWTDVGLALAYRPCPSGNCLPASNDNGLGTSLFVTPFHAAYGQRTDPEACNYYGNVTVTIPEGITGEVQLAVGHFFVIGASDMPGVDIVSTTLTVV